MEKNIMDKLETLTKYIPFIDYILEIDKEKYKKFLNIRQWIINKKRYPYHDLQKIEQSIITQYKNLYLVEDVKVPEDIRKIFNNTSGEIKHKFVNLCSDDEDNNENETPAPESDDELEIVSISLPNCKVEPEEKLFKRRNEFQNDEDHNIVEVYKGECEKTPSPYNSLLSNKCADAIFLDSSSDSECLNKKEQTEIRNFGNNLDNLKDSTTNTSVKNNLNIKNLNGSFKAAELISTNVCESTEKLHKVPDLQNISLPDLEKLSIDELSKILNSLKEKSNIDLEKHITALNAYKSPESAMIIPSTGNQHPFSEVLHNAGDLRNNIPTLGEMPHQHLPVQNHNTNVAQPSYISNGAVNVAPRVFSNRSINLNDPRILKKLEMIQNSPLSSVLAVDLNKCTSPLTGQSYPLERKLISSVEFKKSITYGEYKRRKAAEQQEIRLQKEEQRKRLDVECKEKDNNSIGNNTRNEKGEIHRQTDEIRNILISALQLNEGKTKKTKASIEKTECENGRIQEKKKQDVHDKGSMTKNRKKTDKVNKLFRELKCTVIGYDKLQDYIPKSIGGKRRSSIHARTAIAEQLNAQPLADEENSENNSNCEKQVKRRKKNHDEYYDGGEENLLLNTSDISTTDSSADNLGKSSLEKTKYLILKNQPVVLLERLTKEEIEKYARRKTLDHNRSSQDLDPNKNTTKELSVHLVETKSSPANVVTDEVTIARPILRANIDCQMTERNTRFCVLCKSKPFDLTNHYIRTHKSESYVSRLTWEQLDDLRLRPSFAVPMPRSGSGHSRVTRYNVTCIFCEEEITDAFINFYTHYSTHTGEYAFQCASCKLTKPFRADIQSHQHHSKTCRNSYVQIMYRYPQNTMVIYLHYCSICNFVQLNEANVLKHIVDHHGRQRDNSGCAQKIVLTAIIDGPDKIEDLELSSNTENSKVDVEIDIGLDDEITVRNEAHFDDTFIENNPQLDDFKESLLIDVGKETLNNNLQMSHNNGYTNYPMTIVHVPCVSDNTDILSKGSENILTENSEQLEKKTTVAIKEVSLTTLNLSKEMECLSSKTNKSKRNAKMAFLYRKYPPKVSYYGLFKCMAEDCYFSTDMRNEMIQHFNDHNSSDCPPDEYLRCAYCMPKTDECKTAELLINHIERKHQYNNYQCSICCYRSCDPSNVHIHQQLAHSAYITECFIYKCSASTRTDHERMQHMSLMLSTNVKPILCQYCTYSIYDVSLLRQHEKKAHNICSAHVNGEDLVRLSCIYCSYTDNGLSGMQKHLSIYHPDELSYACKHELKPTTNYEEDSVHNLQLFKCSSLELSQIIKDANSILSESAAPIVEKCGQENIEPVESKPSLEILLKIHEETAKIRLEKLTAHTGISPDTLYNCPEISCGGYFSLYTLWVRHMKIRHNCIICRCPHCPVDREKPVLLPLEEFEIHYEKHRRHTYVCFHCGHTCGREQEIRTHAENVHSDMKSVRLEQIRFNVNYSYFVLIDTELHEERVTFLRELSDILNKYISILENLELQRLNYSWPVSNNSVWLEDLPIFVSFRNVPKKCFNSQCSFRTTDDEVLFEHLRINHPVAGHIFNCSKCDFSLKDCYNWDSIVDHVKMHNSNLYVCCACSYFHHNQENMSLHIRNVHNARDVAFLILLRDNTSIRVSLAVVFAAGELSFSTMQSCFCCNEGGMRIGTYALHLKNYHKLVLRYFCEWCNEQLLGLQSIDEHFKERHPATTFKIRCELAAKCHLSVESVMPLCVKVEDRKHKRNNHISENISDSGDIKVKSEPKDVDSTDESVIVLEDDDIILANEERLSTSRLSLKEKVSIKCIATETLLKPENILTSETNYQHRL